MHYPLWLAAITYLPTYNGILYETINSSEKQVTKQKQPPQHITVCDQTSGKFALAGLLLLLLLYCCWKHVDTIGAPAPSEKTKKAIHVGWYIQNTDTILSFVVFVGQASVAQSGAGAFYFRIVLPGFPPWACSYALIHRFFEHSETFWDFFMTIDSCSRGSIWLSTAEGDLYFLLEILMNRQWNHRSRGDLRKELSTVFWNRIHGTM